MKKKKILIIGSTEKIGGAARISWEIAEKLRSEDYWVRHMVGYKTSNSKYVYQFKQPQILQMLDKIIKLNTVSLFRHFRSYVFANDMCFGVTNELFQHPWYKKADIVHLHNKHGNFIKFSLLSKISQEKKLVWTMHDMWGITSHCVYTDSANDIHHDPLDCKLSSQFPVLWNNKKRLWRDKCNVYSKSKLFIVSPSKWLHRKIKQTVLKKQSLRVVHNGINTNKFIPLNKIKTRKELGLPINRKIVLFIAHGGKKDKRKGWSQSLGMINQMNSRVLFLNIGGRSKDSDKDSNNIKFIPFIKNQSVLNKYYSAADILLFTSQAENCPLVVLEALSSGLPVLSFPVGGVSEIIEHKKNGYLSRINDRIDLQKGANYLLNMKSKEVGLMRKNNRKKALKYFSIEKMVDSYKKIYEQI